MKSKKGISLIVLVITIIVMIVLAGAIILSLNNAGIIGKANEAVEMTNEDEVQTAVDLAYAEYLTNKEVLGTSTLEDWLNEKTNFEGYKIYVIKDEPVAVNEGSLADKFYKGEIKVGDYVDYKATETEKTMNAVDYKFISETNPAKDREVQYKVTSEQKWRVLGVDSKTKELLITSADLVKAIDKATNTEIKFSLSGLYGWVHGESLLDSICSEFGKGKYATKARSMTPDDVAILFDYDKTQFVDTDPTDPTWTCKYGQVTTFGENGIPMIRHPKSDSNGNFIFGENRVVETEYSKYTITNNRFVIFAHDVKEKYAAEYDLIFNFAVKEGYYLNDRHLYGGKYTYGQDEYSIMYYSWFCVTSNSETDRFLGTVFSGSVSNNDFYEMENNMYIRPVVHIGSSITATKDATTGNWMLK